MRNFFLYSLIAAAGTAVVVACCHLLWRAVGLYLINRAGPRPIEAARHAIWRDPGVVERLDLRGGPGGHDGAPAPPFRFLEEHASGSQPCVSVIDDAGRRWRVKWGPEVRSENIAVRVAWACGFFSEVTYFLASGKIDGVPELQRARQRIGEGGVFTEARFELDDPDVRKMFEEYSWAWDDNPFVGTPQLNGLKIVVMLLSNWDCKDRRDVARGSNTAIFEYRLSRWRREARYLITDWGGSMGRWGSNIVTRGRWDPDGFEAQTPEFVARVEGNIVYFGYVGQRTADIAHNISPADVRWLMPYLGRITDGQLREALDASGATDDEADKFTRALRNRITQLGRV
jgi:hypothetical protein